MAENSAEKVLLKFYLHTSNLAVCIIYEDKKTMTPTSIAIPLPGKASVYATGVGLSVLSCR